MFLLSILVIPYILWISDQMKKALVGTDPLENLNRRNSIVIISLYFKSINHF